MTIGEIEARIFYHRQSLITPAAHVICSQLVPPKDRGPIQPHELFPHLIEPPPKEKQIDPRTLSKRERMLARLERELQNGAITHADFRMALADLDGI